MHEICKSRLQMLKPNKDDKTFFTVCRFLERQISEITNPYQIAITAYALTIADSTEKETVFSLLHSVRTEAGNFIS